MRLQDAICGVLRGGRECLRPSVSEVGSGEALAVTGANGAGKSSLLRMIAGLLVVASGSIGYGGGEIDLTLAEQAHYLGHRDALKSSLSVLENLKFWQNFLGGEAKDATASLDAAGIGHAAHLPAAFLSAGQRRRLSIARLLAVRRPIWLLDEPASALDMAGQNTFVSLMNRPPQRRRDHRCGDAMHRWGLKRSSCGSAVTHDRPRYACSTRHSHCDARWRRRADRRAVFLTVVVLMPFAVGPDLALLKRIAGDPLARRDAGEPADAGSPLHCGPGRRLARSHRHEPDAAGTDLRGQGPRTIGWRRGFR